MLHHCERILSGATPNPARMQANLMRTRGLIYSQKILLALVGKGMSREDAYAIVQRGAMKSWSDEEPLADHLLADAAFTARIDAQELHQLMDPKSFLQYIDEIYEACGLSD